MQIIQSPVTLQSSVRNDADKIDHVARQLEGQFAQMMIKSMRDASFGDALFPEENRLFHEMYDQQLAKALTNGKGLGIAAMVARQLRGGDALPPVLEQHTPHLTQHVRTPYQSHSKPHTPESFVSQIWHHAQQAAHELGVNVRALIAQAALETGWGKHGIKRDGSGDAHNLFGIKATGWKGERTNIQTHEYRNGERRNERADFRAYSSVAESFADYVKMLKQNPRTDPDYAKKISAIANGPVLNRILKKIVGAAIGTPTHRLVKIR